MNNREPCKNLEESNRKTVQENTLYYLKNYLHPDRIWDKEITPKQRINQIRYANVNWEVVSDHIKGMDYQDFLRTPYWKAIAAHIKYRAGYKCQLCNSANNLVTHHRDYGIHGFEHAHMQELIVLCDGCHSKFHDRLPKWKLKMDDRRSKLHDHFFKWKLKMSLTLTILFVFFVRFLMERKNVVWCPFF
ncbi:MAG: hypothetical protein JSR39_08575 [Verrucomicrobia bacterium]|nr:hypothetical protein [Verrucomicrobiota bacterium]